MTITVAITPEVQAELARQAAAHGRAMEAYAASLLEGAVRLPAGADRLSQDRLENTLREMAEFSLKLFHGVILIDVVSLQETVYLVTRSKA